MKVRMLLLALATGTFAAIGCTQIDRAVKGIEAGPGGWTRVGEARTEMASDVEYLGASANGLIIVRTADGRVQVWQP